MHYERSNDSTGGLRCYRDNLQQLYQENPFPGVPYRCLYGYLHYYQMRYTMDIQLLYTSNGPQKVSSLVSKRQRSDMLLFLAILIGTLCLVSGLVLVGVVIGFTYALTILAVLIIAILVIRWPTFGFFFV